MKTKRQRATGAALFRVIEKWPKRLFAVGDIHGCFSELSALLTHLREKESLSADDLVIFIGDYVDRGPASKEVIDLLLAFKVLFPNTVFLKGNHEDMLLAFLGLGGTGGEVYLANGGFDFFRSYGIAPLGPLSDIRAALPPEHLAFLENLETGVVVAEFLFVHAGLDPSKPLEKQTEGDVLWIRTDFTAHDHPFEKTVVFGHTPYETIFLHLPYKIGIDTGAIYGNKLSCVELVDGSVYQVEAGDTEVQVGSLAKELEPD